MERKMDDNKINNLETNSGFFRKDEFAEGVTEAFSIEEIPAGLSRRRFLALMGASAALVSVGCNDYHDKGEIVPYSKKPEEMIIGRPNYYASTCSGCSLSCGILIKTREGRPVKVIGNPDHPASKGKICSKGEANLLNLYDPSRIKDPAKKDGFGFSNISWDKVDSEILSKLKNGVGEIALVASTTVSPLVNKLLTDFREAFSGSKVYYYDLFNDNNRRTAFFKCYGQTEFPLIAWEDAKIILTLEADLFGGEAHKIETKSAYTKNRNVGNPDKFSRHYAVEGNMSLTGMNADYRIRLRPDAQYEFVLALITEVAAKFAGSSFIDSRVRQIIDKHSLKEVARKHSMNIKTLKKLVMDLGRNKGKGIVYGGKTLSVNAHIAINLLNEILENTSLYNKTNSPVSHNVVTTTDELQELTKKMKNGTIKAVIHFDSNPVYQFPSNFDYKKALTSVPTVISLSELMNETTAESNYVLPIHHNFEAWGDYKTRSGFYTLQQPVIAPIYNTRQKEGILLSWISGAKYTEKLFHSYLKKEWQTNVFPKAEGGLPFEKFWQKSLHDGVLEVPEAPNKNFSFSGSVTQDLSTSAEAATGICVQLTENHFIGDGHFSNNGWMQELPHPVSKITWDNYAAISDKTAKRLALNTDDMIKIKAKDGKEIEIPVFIQAGQADEFINIELGYGRKNVPVIGLEVGFNAIPLLNSDSGYSQYLIAGVAVSVVASKHHLVSTQDYYDFNDNLTKDAHLKRHLIKEITLDQYKKNPKILKDSEKIHHISMYEDQKYPNEKWAMAIDLNKCIGCADCVAACNVENNIPVVGKDQVQKGREMQWLRIDRYYSGTVDEPKPVFQPMMCQHCDHAPCENVCPVVATTHSTDGLNQMVYNRCVGTRYCSNNCPYKVRRFNFHNFRDHFADGYYLADSVSLAHNPEVTVRSRGVMEKCTFCIQRIMDVRTLALSEGKAIKDYELKTACMEACPTNAITFGDMNDPKSEISRLRKHNLGYKLLEELNINPNVTYVAKLINIESEEV